MRNADPRNGVIPSPFNAQLNAYIIPGYSFGNASTLPTLLIVSGKVASKKEYMIQLINVCTQSILNSNV